jgi:hypothetical protein
LSPVSAVRRSWPTWAFLTPCWNQAEVQATAKTLGLELAALEIRRADDIAPSFKGLKSRADALYVCSDPLVIASRIRIKSLALDARLPIMHSYREFVEAGGLISYEMALAWNTLKLLSSGQNDEATSPMTAPYSWLIAITQARMNGSSMVTATGIITRPVYALPQELCLCFDGYSRTEPPLR